MDSKLACKNLVLDAGPLLSLAPLRGLAEHYFTVPLVLSELKDKNAKEHFEKLGLSTGIKIEVREPDAASLSQVIHFAKKTGDYPVLSHADLHVLALTFALDAEEKANQSKDAAGTLDDGTDTTAHGETMRHDVIAGDTTTELLPQLTRDQSNEVAEVDEAIEELSISNAEGDDSEGSPGREPLNVVLEYSLDNSDNQPRRTVSEDTSTTDSRRPNRAPLFDDPPEDDDGEGGWITPDNVELYKSHALDLFPISDASDPFITTTTRKRRGKRGSRQQQARNESNSQDQIVVGCMTADFAMQNVLLQMNLNLVGIEGKRIEKVKTWVLRCHACFKICKDQSKKFCPSCGNPSLLRASITAKSPTTDDSSPALEVHLKKNFVYRIRGTKYSIPKPKPGSSRTGSGEGLILREDQIEYMRAKRRAEGQRQREERKILQKSLTASRDGENAGIKLGNWTDPDWMPEMLSLGVGGKGRRAPDGRMPLGPDGMPVVGYGKKNPNERRRKR